jgi:cell division protein FtsB
MSGFANRLTIRRWAYYALLSLTAAGFFWITGYDALTELTDSWGKERQIEQAIQQIEAENHRIEGAIEELAPEGKAVERIARQDLGWAKRGEIVVKIPEKR